jgi:hypothetical protein
MTNTRFRNREFGVHFSNVELYPTSPVIIAVVEANANNNEVMPF